MSITRTRTLTQGVVAGFIGFATVALIFAVVNVAMGRSPLYTANMLGAAWVYRIANPTSVSISAAFVLGYTAVHLAVFLAFGLFAAWLARVADRGRQLWFVALFFMIFVSFHLVAAVQMTAVPMRSVLPEWMIWGAGMAASITMAAYLLRAHPRMRAPQPW